VRWVLQAAAAAAMSPLPNPRTPIVPAAAAEAAAWHNTNTDPHAGTRRALFSDGTVHNATTSQPTAVAAAAAADPEAKRRGKLALLMLSKQVGSHSGLFSLGCFEKQQHRVVPTADTPNHGNSRFGRATQQRVCGCLLTRASPEGASG
jgi:hypothetical protein